ncbi:DMT family transporter [soil metagenome]
MRAAFAALLLGGVCIGFAPIFVRWADTGPVASAFWRMLIASAVLWLWRLWAARGKTLAPLVISRDAVLSGLMFAGDLAVWHFSILLTTVANATLLANLAPVIVTLSAWWLGGQKPRSAFLAGLAVALVGAATLVGLSFHGATTGALGDLLGIATAFFYAAYMFSITRARATTDALTLMAVSSSVTAIALLPIAFGFSIAQHTPFVPGSLQGWAVLAGLALLAQVAGQTLIALAAARLPVALSSTTLLIQPLVATVAAWAWFYERLSVQQCIGAVVLLAGLYFARRSSLEPRRAPQSAATAL